MDQKLGKSPFWDDLARIYAALPPSQSIAGAGGLAIHTHADATQGGPLVVGTTDTGATAGSVIFAGALGVQQEDNAGLFYDDAQDYFGVNTGAAPAAHLEVNAATATDIALIVQTTDDNATKNIVEIHDSGGNNLVEIDRSGNIGIGINPAYRLAVADSAANTLMSIETYSTNNAQQSALRFIKSSSATIDTKAVTAANEDLGEIQAYGVNSSPAIARAAAILFEQDGNAGASFVGGRITFWTGTNAAAPTEHMRMNDVGWVGMGVGEPETSLDVAVVTGDGIIFRNLTEAVGEKVQYSYLAGTGAIAATNTVGQVQAEITQANPATLMGKMFFRVNTGDNVQTVMTIAPTKLVGIGVDPTAAKLEVDQSGAAAGIPVALLNQTDVSEQFINFTIPGGDQDMRLETLGVTGTPERGWREADDQYYQTKGLIIDSGDLNISTVAYIDATGNAWFDGHIGVSEITVQSTSAIAARETYTDVAGTINNIYSWTDFDPIANFTTTVYGLEARVDVDTNSTQGAGTITGIRSWTRVVPGATAALNSIRGFDMTVDVEDGSAATAYGALIETPRTAAGSAVAGYGIHIDQVGAANITTLYGLSIDDITNGVTNWSIYTRTGDCRFGDAVHIADFLYHDGDLDTFVSFIPDAIDIQAGGVQFLTITEDGAQDMLVINDGGVDVDFTVKASGVADAFTITGATGQPRFGLLTAGYVKSDASGDLSVGSGSTDLPLPPVAIGDTLIAAGVAPLAWTILSTPGAAGYARVSTATTEAWDQNPNWTGNHTWTSAVSARPILTIENATADTQAPTIDFYKNRGVPAGGDDLGAFDFFGNTSTGAQERYAYILAESLDVTNGDTGGGLMFMAVMDGTDRSLLQLSGYNGAVNEGEVIVNDDSQDVDFIVKSDTHLDALVVQGSDGEITLGMLATGLVKATAGVLSIAVATDVPAHDILSLQHGDTLAAAVSRGSLIYGNATPAWAELVAGAAHQLLQINAGGTDPGWASFDWDNMAAGIGADMVHDHSAAGEGGTITHAITTGQTTDDHHAEAHVVNSTGPHAEGGLTGGHVLRASAAAAFSFAAIQGSDLPWSGVATRVAYWSAANTLTSDAGLTYASGTDSLTAGNYFTVDGGEFGISGNELLTVNAAGNFTFSGVGSVVVPDGAWIGADANASWVYDTSNNDVTCQDSVGIKTTTPQFELSVTGDIFAWKASGDPQLRLGVGNTEAAPTQGWSLRIDDSDSDKFKIRDITGAAEILTLDTSGNMGLGTESMEAKLHLFETGALSQIIETESDTQAPNLTFIRSLAGPAAVTDGKVIGGVRGFGYDGAGDIMGGRIRFEVDGTPGVNDMPTRFIIELTADGAAAVTERVRVDQAGRVGIGTAGAVATSAILELSSTTGAFLVSRMTTAQRNALTAVNGMIIYNSTDGEFNFREAGSWVSGSGLA